MKLTVQRGACGMDGLSFLLLQHTRFGGECG